MMEMNDNLSRMEETNTLEKRYHPAGTISDLKPGAGRSIEIGNDVIAVFNFGGEIFALNDLCPHRGAPLCEGFLDAGKVFCPWHCFDFNLRTGECTMVPSMSVATYPVKIEGDTIYILY